MSSSSSISCDLTALTPHERQAHRQVAETVLTSAEAVREVSNGYAFRLPTETVMIQQAAAFISRERLCCPFFDFRLEVSSDHGPVWLAVSGPDEVKQYIENNVLPKIDVPPA